jgi:hypothetical protein
MRLWSLAIVFELSCDKAGPLADIDASSSSLNAAAASLGQRSASSSAFDAATSGSLMPPRPVPTTSPTVRITMPVEVQLQAIQYMQAMQAPEPSDAPADPAYAKQIANALAPIGKPDVVSSGRRIDIVLPRGCDATWPRQAVARHTGATLTTLLAHGVLVLRCADHEVQCLQSTRDVDDVLCTHK